MSINVYNCSSNPDGIDLYENYMNGNWSFVTTIDVNDSPLAYNYKGKNYNIAVCLEGVGGPTSPSFPVPAPPASVYFTQDAVSTTSCPANGGSSSSSMMFIIIAVVVGVVLLAGGLAWFFITR